MKKIRHKNDPKKMILHFAQLVLTITTKRKKEIFIQRNMNFISKEQKDQNGFIALSELIELPNLGWCHDGGRQ